MLLIPGLKPAQQIEPICLEVVELRIPELFLPVCYVSRSELEAGAAGPECVGNIWFVLLTFEQAEEPVFVAIAAPRGHDVILGGDPGQYLAGQGEGDLEMRDSDVLEDQP